MNAPRTFDYRDSLLLIIGLLICSCLCQAVNSEDCTAVDDGSHCHCRTDSGYEINLSPLANDGSARFTVHASSDTYTYNPCKPFSKGDKCQNVAICQESTDSGNHPVGTQDSVQYNSFEPSGAPYTLTLSYNAPADPGDQCPDNKRYGNVHLCANKTRKVPSYLSTKLTNVIIHSRYSMTEKTQFPGFMFMCFQVVQKHYLGEVGQHRSPFDSMLSQLHLCQKLPKSIDDFILTSEYSCPRKPSSSGLSPGSILLIVCLVCLIVYFVGGVLLLRFWRGARGTEQIPNYEFWKSLPGLVKDGCVFFFTSLGCCKQDAAYQKI